jgi:hypothetical protein
VLTIGRTGSASPSAGSCFMPLLNALITAAKTFRPGRPGFRSFPVGVRVREPFESCVRRIMVQRRSKPEASRGKGSYKNAHCLSTRPCVPVPHRSRCTATTAHSRHSTAAATERKARQYSAAHEACVAPDVSRQSWRHYFRVPIRPVTRGELRPGTDGTGRSDVTQDTCRE